MDEHARRERIEHWVGDFTDRPAFAGLPAPAQEHGPAVLVAFLEAACAAHGIAPEDVGAHEVRHGLLDGVAQLDLPASVSEHVPALCGAFLEDLETVGRLAGGRALGLQAVALGPAYLDAAAGRAAPLTRPAAKIGRNDPCPCGSGRKYKRCCGA